MNRALSKEIFYALKNKDGLLSAVLRAVKENDCLDLEFRGNSCEIYYRKHRLFEISYEDEDKDGFVFHPLSKGHFNYGPKLTLPSIDANHLIYEQVVEYISKAIVLVNSYFLYAKYDAEFDIQQLIVKENNYSPYSSDTDFYILDMEYGDKTIGMKADLVALRWDSTGPARKKPVVQLYLIELKQGIKTCGTTSKNPGLYEHFSDYKKFTAKPDNVDEFIKDMKNVFIQKYELGLIKINSNSIDGKEIIVKPDIRMGFVLANCKTAGSNMNKDIQMIVDNYGKEEAEKCAFFTSSFMGYGLYTKFIKDINYISSICK